MKLELEKWLSSLAAHLESLGELLKIPNAQATLWPNQIKYVGWSPYFESSSGDSNVQPRLRTTALDPPFSEDGKASLFQDDHI